MSWKTDLALKRIFNSFKRLKTQIFTQDIEALKSLNEAITDSEKTYVNDNLLYAKLLCYVLNQNLHHHGSITVSKKVVADILKEPLDFHLQLLHKNLIHQDNINYLKTKGIDFDDEKSTKTNQQIGKEFLDKLNSQWSYENVLKSFYNSANDFLKETDNYI